MATTTEALSNIKLELQSLRTRLYSLSPADAVATALGVYVIWGCKVTAGESEDDMIVKLEGHASGDEAMHNPRAVDNPQRPFQYPNIASLLDGPFHSLDQDAVVDDAPPEGLARYDIAYIYVGPAGAGFAIAAGTPSEEIKELFDLNGLDDSPYGSSSNAFDPELPIGACPVARIYVEGGATGIPESRIAVIRPVVPNVGFEQMTTLLDQAEEAMTTAVESAQQVAADAEQVAEDKVVTEAAKDVAVNSELAATGAAALATTYPWRVAQAEIRAAGLSLISNDKYLAAFRDKKGRLSWLSALRENGGPPTWVLDFISAIYTASGRMRRLEHVEHDLASVEVDEAGNPWWTAVQRSDGGPTPWAVSLLKNRMGFADFDIPAKQTLLPGLDLLVAITDEYRNATWLSARRSDGGPPEWVIDHLKSRLALKVPDRIVPTPQKFAAWGSSTIELMNAPLSAMASSFGAAYFQGGDGGVLIQHTAAQLGSTPIKLTFPDDTIPTSGAVTVTSSNVNPSSSMRAFAGVISGVEGTLSCPGGVFTFTRAWAGPTVEVAPDSEFIPISGTKWRDAYGLLNVGKNNFSASVAGRDLVVIEYTRRMMEYLCPYMTRTLVMNHFVDTNTPEVSMERDQILATNASYANDYGDLVIDLNGYITGEQVWVDTGITPTSEDLEQQAIGNKPPSLSRSGGTDPAHLSEVANLAVVNNLIKPRAISLGWYPGD